MKDKEIQLPILRYTILGLILLHIPGFTLAYLSDSISSVLSYLSYGLILLYVILKGKSGNNIPLLTVGLFYFLIGSLINQLYLPDIKLHIVTVIKFFIIIWGGYEVMHRTSSKELWVFMILGALSILANIFLFNDPLKDIGRYSGFYLDPNNAGLICSMGFALSFAISKKIRLLSKIIFTILGLITFSRTFIITWLIINVLSIKIDLKNAKMILIGFGILSTLLIYNEFLPTKNARLEQLGAMIGGEKKKASALENDSRWDTWSRYFEALGNKPFFGNGYKAFGGNGVAPPVGVHNTYLLIWGEAGIFALLLFISYLFYLSKKCLLLFYELPYALMMFITFVLFLMTNHNFFTTDYLLLILIWIHIKISEKKIKETPNSISTI